MSKIVALVDGSVYSESVCDYAAWVATRKGVPVEVLHVLPRSVHAQNNLSGALGLGARSKLMEELSELDEKSAKLNMQRGRAILEDAEARLRADGVADVVARMRNGDLIEELHASEVDADLVVVGKRGEDADFATMHVGSHIERAVRTSTRPVLVTSRAFAPVESFLIAFDGGASSIKAVNHVAQSKVFGGLKCTLLFAGPKTTDNQRTVDGAAATLRNAGYDLTVSFQDTQPEIAITEAVETGGFDMLLMGAYGHSRIRRLFIGSTTTEMVQTCKVPVLLFR